MIFTTSPSKYCHKFGNVLHNKKSAINFLDTLGDLHIRGTDWRAQMVSESNNSSFPGNFVNQETSRDLWSAYVTRPRISSDSMELQSETVGLL